MEPYETERMIKSVEYTAKNTITVLLSDGRKQVIEAKNMDKDDISVKVSEYMNGEYMRTETTE